jgi:osmoprotectant transport system substrate-binding protein
VVDKGGRLLRLRVAVLCVLAASATLACSAGASREGARAQPRGPDVVVASFNFPESELLAQIYAQALADAGIPVDRELNLGPRELVLPAFQQGLVDLVPEYLGSALTALQPGATVGPADTASERAELVKAVQPWGGEVLAPAPAENQNGLVVTRATAEKYGLRAVSDLSRVASHLILTGPAECPQRDYCLQGLQRVYGLRFRGFVPFDAEQERVTALDEQVADVAVMFTTDAYLATGDLVLLADDRNLQPAENITPLVSGAAMSRYGEPLAQTLDAVSSRLTTANLIFLNWRVQLDGKDPRTEARGWLERHGLLTSPTRWCRPVSTPPHQCPNAAFASASNRDAVVSTSREVRKS